VHPRGRCWRAAGAALVLCLAAAFVALGAYQYNSPLDGVTPERIGCNWLFVNNASATFTSCGLDNAACLAPAAPQWQLARCPGACLVDWSSPVLGAGNYTGTSRICAAAIHAGAISAGRGGCFYYRLGGAQASYAGSTSNGVRSAPFGWYPLSLEFRPAEGGAACGDGVIYTNVYVLVVGAALVLLARPPAAGLERLAGPEKAQRRHQHGARRAPCPSCPARHELLCPAWADRPGSAATRRSAQVLVAEALASARSPQGAPLS
jgi:hypothetical protein